MMKQTKALIGIMSSALLMMSYLTPNSLLAVIADAFPDTALQTVQMITAMPSLIGVVVALITGRLVRYIYKKHLMLIADVFYLVGGFLPYFFHQSVWQILMFASLLGIGLGIMLTCVTGMICDVFGDKSSRVMGVQGATICAGGLLFLWLGGQLGKNDWTNCFLAYLLVIVILVINIFCLPKGELEVPTENKGQAAKGSGKLPGIIWFYSIFGFLIYVFVNVYNSNISMLLDIRSLGGAVEASYASMCYNLAGMVAGCLTGSFINWIQKKVFILAAFLAAAGMLVTFVSHNLPGVAIGGAFCGIAFALFTPSGNFFASQCAGDGNRSLCIAIFTSVSNFGQALSPLIIAFLMQLCTLEQRFLWSGVACVLIAILGIVKFCGPNPHR